MGKLASFLLARQWRMEPGDDVWTLKDWRAVENKFRERWEARHVLMSLAGGARGRQVPMRYTGAICCLPPPKAGPWTSTSLRQELVGGIPAQP